MIIESKVWTFSACVTVLSLCTCGYFCFHQWTKDMLTLIRSTKSWKYMNTEVRDCEYNMEFTTDTFIV